MFGLTFFDNPAFATFLISFFPLVELKGALPFGMSFEIWGENALSAWQAFFFAFLGSALAVPVVAILFKPVVCWLSRFRLFKSIISFLTNDVRKRSCEVERKSNCSTKHDHNFKKKQNIIRMISVFLFVAFPLPLTGVWTGSAFAVLLGLNFLQVCFSVILGNLVCGVIVLFVCSIFPNSTTIFLLIFLAMVAFSLIFKIVRHLRDS